MLQKKDVIDDEIINEEIIYNGNENRNDDDDDDDDDILNDINEENKIIDSKIIQDIANEFEVTLPLQKKRGRKSKKEVDMLNKLKENNVHDD